MHHLSIDIETYSPEPIAKTGLYKYAQHPDFKILLFGYSLDGEPPIVIDMTQPGAALDYQLVQMLLDPNVQKHAYSGVSEDWTSNRVIRVLDGWASDTARIFGQQYLGVETNSETGRSLFKADLVSLGKQYEGIDAISNFLPDDVTVQQGNGKRDVAVFCALQPNDSMEKLYMKVTVN